MGGEGVGIWELPEGWELAPLGELGQYINGRAFKPAEWEKEGLPIIRIQNLTNPKAPFNHYSKPVKDRYYVRNGDLLISWSATLGSYIWNRGDAILNQHIFRVAVNTERVDRLFLKYAIDEALDELRKRTHGSTMRHVTKGVFEAFPIPLPPLDEQRRIVARIEELFDRIAEARRLRAAAAGDTERLVPAALEEIFAQPDSGWLTAVLNKVAFVQTGTAKGRRFGNRKTVELPYLRVANVQAGYLMLDEIKTIRIAEDELERYRLHPGDLLLTEGGDFDKLGRGAVWNAEIEPCIHQNHVFAVRFDRSKILPRFAEYEMQSWYAKTYFLRSAKKTTNLASINKTQLSAFPICYPSLREQRHIIEYLDGVQSLVVELKGLQAASAAELERLSGVVLARAFRGEL